MLFQRTISAAVFCCLLVATHKKTIDQRRSFDAICAQSLFFVEKKFLLIKIIVLSFSSSFSFFLFSNNVFVLGFFLIRRKKVSDLKKPFSPSRAKVIIRGSVSSNIHFDFFFFRNNNIVTFTIIDRRLDLTCFLSPEINRLLKITCYYIIIITCYYAVNLTSKKHKLI